MYDTEIANWTSYAIFSDEFHLEEINNHGNAIIIIIIIIIIRHCSFQPD